MESEANLEALTYAEASEDCASDARFDFFAGPSKLELKPNEFTLEGIDPAMLNEPIKFEFSTTVPMTLNLPK